MNDEITALLDVAIRLDGSGVAYMLTGSMALNLYAMPRMTRDVDLVAAVMLGDVPRMETIFPQEAYYVSVEAAMEAVVHQTSFNVIHLETMTKIDIIIRKREEYRLEEFQRRQTFTVREQPISVVSKEDLILSKLDWSKESTSERQLNDVRNLLATGLRHGISQDMVRPASPERYADTGYGVKDTSPEINRMIFEKMMARTPEERLLIGFSMLGTAKELIAASLPKELPEGERRRLVYERLYGEKLPDGFALA
jgi:hypothetical protein